MTPLPLERRVAIATTPVLACGALAPPIAYLLAGSDGGWFAMAAVVVAAAIVLLSETTVTLFRFEQPLSRLLFTMLCRGGLALAAITSAVVLGGYEPKLVVLVAAPLYASLIVGEVLSVLPTGTAGERT